MIILRYCRNAYTIFRTFSGLNQRFNNVLVDRRLHLFNDVLYENTNDKEINYYYNTQSFQDISQNLLSLKATKNDTELNKCLQSLVSTYIKEKDYLSNHQFQSSIEQFQTIRAHLTDVEIQNLDKELKASEEVCAKNMLFDVSSMINLSEPLTDREIFRIIFHEYTLNSSMSSDADETFQRIVGNLIKSDQLAVIRFIYADNECARIFFQRFWNSRQNVDIMTANRKRRRKLFGALLNGRPSSTWLINSNLLWILLQKKERKLVKQLLKLSPLLINRLDEDGNNLLLYVCFKVRGCRHGLIEFLI
ncbi:unnamed protein product, partial [Rotaria socialis]